MSMERFYEVKLREYEYRLAISKVRSTQKSRVLSVQSRRDVKRYEYGAILRSKIARIRIPFSDFESAKHAEIACFIITV